MIASRDAEFLFLAVERGLIGLEAVRRVIRKLDESRTKAPPSAAVLVIEMGYVSQDQVVRLIASTAVDSAGPSWQPDALLKELERLIVMRSARRHPAAPTEPVAETADALGSTRNPPAKRRFWRSDWFRGFIYSILLAIGLILGAGLVASLWMRQRSSPSPQVPSAKEPAAPASARPHRPASGAQATAGRDGQRPSRGSKTDGTDPDGSGRPQWNAIPGEDPQVRREFDALVLAAQAAMDQGEFRNAFSRAEAFARKYPKAPWPDEVRRLLDWFRRSLQEEFAVLARNMAKSLGDGDLGLANQILNRAREYSSVANLDELRADTRRMETECRSATRSPQRPPGPKPTDSLAPDILDVFTASQARLIGTAGVDLRYDFATDDQGHDWWFVGLIGKVTGGALALSGPDLSWPGATWVIHKAEFDSILQLAFEMTVHHILDVLDKDSTPHLGWGLHLSSVPEGPWDIPELERGISGWLQQDGLYLWSADQSPWRGPSPQKLQPNQRFHVRAELKDTEVYWWINGTLVRRVPARSDLLGQRLVIMVQGASVSIDNVQITGVPRRTWLSEDLPRTSRFRTAVQEIQGSLAEGQAVDLIRERDLRGFRYDPTQWCRTCPQSDSPDEICAAAPVAPILPALLPIPVQHARLSGEIMPIRDADREWYFAFLQGGLSGFSVALYFQKGYLGLYKLERTSIPPSVEDRDETFDVHMAPGQYHPFDLQFRSGRIEFRVDHQTQLEAGETWDRDGFITLGGYDWGGSGHYHIRKLRLEPLPEPAKPQENP